MAVSEMDYMNIGGGREPITVAEFTATATMTYGQVLIGLKNNGGQKLKNVITNYANVKLINAYGNEYIKVYTSNDGNGADFVSTVLGSRINIYDAHIDFTTDSNNKYMESLSAAAPTDKTSNTITSDFVGTWKIVY